jgi:hypothetical protein
VVKENRFIKMEAYMKENMVTIKKMDKVFLLIYSKEYLNGMMALYMKVVGLRILFMIE